MDINPALVGFIEGLMIGLFWGMMKPKRMAKIKKWLTPPQE